MVIFSQPSHWTFPPEGPHRASTNVMDSTPASTTTRALSAATGATTRALVVAGLRGSSLAILHIRIEVLGSRVGTLRPLLGAGGRLRAGRTLLLSLLCVGLAAGILLLVRLLLLLGFLLGLLLVLRCIQGVPRAGTVVIFLPARARVLVNVSILPSIHISA